MKRSIILGLIFVIGVGVSSYYTHEALSDDDIGSPYENTTMIENISDYERSNK
tara:strand:- start:494 stop:652 length:159 start_codon:yes stop_codon:yes gene_type:complete